METENGAPSLASTKDARLDLFFKAVRDIDTSQLIELIKESWKVNKLHTMKILMNWRDCRGGKGDYDKFVIAMSHIADVEPAWLHCNIPVIPEYGRYLDLIKIWHVVPPASQALIMEYIVDQLKKDHASTDPSISLLAKWIPSEKKKWDKGFVKALCRALFKVSSVKSNHIKQLRKEYLTPLRTKLKIVERNLVERDYTFPYEAVPSCAMQKYKKAFKKNDEERFQEYLDEVANGKKKINAGQVYPHDLVRQYLQGEDENQVIEEQWKVLVEKVKQSGAFDQSLVVCDVSGSMEGTPMEVAIALGLLSQTKLITFSANPKLHDVPYHLSLHDQVRNVRAMDWGMNTNLELVMDLVATMPGPIKRLYIFSDMQFDEAVTCSRFSSKTSYELLKEKLGGNIPQIVFWNLRGNTKDFPTGIDDNGVIMLSGYSPALLTMITDAKDINPLNIMLSLIESERYNKVQSPQ